MAAAREARDAWTKFPFHDHFFSKCPITEKSKAFKRRAAREVLARKSERRFEQQLLLERPFQGRASFCSSKGRMSQTAIGSPTTGGSKAAAAPSSAAGQSVNKRCVPRPPAWLDPRIRSSEHLRTARRQRLPGAPERAVCDACSAPPSSDIGHAHPEAPLCPHPQAANGAHDAHDGRRSVTVSLPGR